MNLNRIFFILLLLPSYLQAQTIEWQGQQEPISFANKVKVLEDPNGTYTFEDVFSEDMQNQFVASEHPNLILGYSESVFWVKFTFENNSNEELVMEAAQAGLPICEFYYLDDDGEIVSYKAGAKTIFKDRVIKSSFQVFPLAKGKHDYYLRLTSNSGPIPLNIYKIDEFQSKAITQKFVYGIYLGLMFFVFLSNFFFFFSLRNHLYLVNAFNVIIFTCYSLVVVDCFVVYFFEQFDIIFWYTTIPPLGVTIQTLYCLWFLEVKRYRPKLFRVMIGVVLVFCLWFVLKFYLPFSIVQPINTLQALLSFFILGFVGISLGKAGNKFGYYFAMTYFVYFLLVLAEATYINFGKPSYLLGFSFSGYATIIEALTLSFLLTKRYEWENKEIQRSKLNAQKDALAKTIENARLIREQNKMLEKLVQERTIQLIEEKRRSDDLLQNILPDEIADELNKSREPIVRAYDTVTVLYTDFVNFTDLSKDLSPAEYVQEMDACFKAFDEIVEKNQLERIKTSGDAFIAISGLVDKESAHAKLVLQSALEMREWVIKHNGKFKIRIGIHTGPLFAGILGIKKLPNDIWGDTINLAARMEHNCLEGHINVSGSTYDRIKEEFNFTYRGKILTKYTGKLDMYFADPKLESDKNT